MTRTITGLFDTRREAEMTVEHLVQEHHLDRSRIRTYAAGEDNSSGTVLSGADAASVAEGDPPEGARAGRIAVSVQVEEGETADVLASFRTFGASGTVSPAGA